MADLSRILSTIIEPALATLPASMDSREARVMLLAIGLQESRLVHRWQVIDQRRPEVRGPARGLWQFERGGGVVGVLNHPSSIRLAHVACERRGVTPAPSSVWMQLAEDDILACIFARLLLWTDPAPLPRVNSQNVAWAYYIRNWRPGKPHPRTWSGHYVRSVAAASGAP